MEKFSMESMEEICEAALILCTMKYDALDPEVTIELEGLNKKYLESKVAGHNSHPPLPQMLSLEQDLNLLQGYNLSDVPAVPNLRGLIGVCSKPFEKQLTPSDVDDCQSRLAIPKSVVMDWNILMNEDESLSDGIPVTVYDIDGKEYGMVLKVWTSKMHVLTAGWKAFRQHHELIEGKNFVTLWMFRHVQTQKLCFVITVRRDPDAESLKRKRKLNLNNAPSKRIKLRIKFLEPKKK